MRWDFEWKRNPSVLCLSRVSALTSELRWRTLCLFLYYRPSDVAWNHLLAGMFVISCVDAVFLFEHLPKSNLNLNIWFKFLKVCPLLFLNEMHSTEHIWQCAFSPRYCPELGVSHTALSVSVVPLKLEPCDSNRLCLTIHRWMEVFRTGSGFIYQITGSLGLSFANTDEAKISFMYTN